MYLFLNDAPVLTSSIEYILRKIFIEFDEIYANYSALLIENQVGFSSRMVRAFLFFSFLCLVDHFVYMWFLHRFSA